MGTEGRLSMTGRGKFNNTHWDFEKEFEDEEAEEGNGRRSHHDNVYMHTVVCSLL